MRNVSNSPFLDSSTTNYTNGSHASSTHGQINPRSHNSSTSTDPPNNNTQWGNVSHSVHASIEVVVATSKSCHNMIAVLIPLGCLICDLGWLHLYTYIFHSFQTHQCHICNIFNSKSYLCLTIMSH